MISILFGLLPLLLLIFMSWRILEKAGFPGWFSLVHLLTVTGIGALATIAFFWVVAFIRWPRDDEGLVLVGGPGAAPPPPRQPTGASVASAPIPLPAPPPTPASAGVAPASTTVTWSLEGKLGDGTPGRLVVDDSRPVYVVSASEGPDVLLVPDPSISSPHARFLTAPGRIGLEDLGSAGGTWIDGIRLLPSHGARDIGNSRVIRFGAVELSLARL